MSSEDHSRHPLGYDDAQKVHNHAEAHLDAHPLAAVGGLEAKARTKQSKKDLAELGQREERSDRSGMGARAMEKGSLKAQGSERLTERQRNGWPRPPLFTFTPQAHV